MKFLKIIFYIVLIILLTILTQVGGVIFILTLFIYPSIKKRLSNDFLRKIVFPTVFILLYSLISFIVVPRVAKLYGRVPLPVFTNKTLKPLNIMTCILNRHYVRPALKNNIENVAEKISKKYPNTIVSYLDANFPFINGFSLLPHLSHSDGKKLDISLFYKEKSGKEINNNAPSFMGYGVYEEPKSKEYDMPENCNRKGYWQYSILEKVVPQWNKKEMIFDQKRTKYLIQLLTKESTTSKIFIEPHLKTRMNLSSSKIRFHGCRAVRHDDHLHLQIK